jgi:hypothetical protein
MLQVGTDRETDRDRWMDGRTTQKTVVILRSADHTENTSHVIAKQCWNVTSSGLRGSVYWAVPRSGLHNPVVPLLRACISYKLLFLWLNRSWMEQIRHSMLQLRPLLGNGLLNAFPLKQTCNHRTYIARQRNCKHASLTTEVGVFRVVREEELSWRQSVLQVRSWRRIRSRRVWSEDFICAVVQRYLECDSYSSCVKIRCQETDTEIF